MKSCPRCRQRFPTTSAYCFVDGSALHDLDDARIGTTLGGRYLVEEVLGIGGFAVVYRGRQKLIDRPCAIKVMNPASLGDPVVRERFRREARAAQRLAHPNIIEIFDQGEADDGAAYLVMEMLVGESLAEIVDARPVPVARALPILVQIARALARAHDFDVIHRDLKPENVFVCAGDLVKLLDFGIARTLYDVRLTGPGEVFGTPQYMAPERIAGGEAGPATDLYALGVIAYEALTGKLPYAAPDVPTLFSKHLRDPVPRLRDHLPSAPASLERLITALMAKEPEQRPVDAHGVLSELGALSRELGVPVPPEPEGASPEPSRSSPPVAVDRWRRHVEIFERMLGRAFGAARPSPLGRALDELRRGAEELSRLRAQGLEHQRRLEVVETRGRDGRRRFGAAMDALGEDLSRVRAEARALAQAVDGPARRARELAKKAKGAHEEVVFWEGRSGFLEPYPQLAEAYRTMASLVDAWGAARREELLAVRAAADKERSIDDLQFQIQQLRERLLALEREIESERSTTEAELSTLGRRADATEGEMVGLASQLSGALRSRAELRALFAELEGEVARL